MIEDIKTSVDTINKITEMEDKDNSKVDASVVANDYVIVNPTPSNDSRTSAEYNRGFAMGVKSSFITAGSVVAAGYLMKGAESMYKKITHKEEKDEEKAKARIAANVQQPIGQQAIEQQVMTQIQKQQTVQQQVVQIPQSQPQVQQQQQIQPAVQQQVVTNVVQ